MSKKDNLLNYIPHRCYPYEVDDQGLVTLFIPRFGKSKVGVWLQRVCHLPDIRISLDPMGSFIWQACDGNLSLGSIALQLKDAFGEKVEPLYPRFITFVRQMVRNKLVELSKDEQRRDS